LDRSKEKQAGNEEEAESSILPQITMKRPVKKISFDGIHELQRDPVKLVLGAANQLLNKRLPPRLGSIKVGRA
jgi:hypothetical protein